MMAQALSVLVKELQSELRQGMLGYFEPFFELVGSMAEGTRIGLANELDLVLKFKALFTLTDMIFTDRLSGFCTE